MTDETTRATLNKVCEMHDHGLCVCEMREALVVEIKYLEAQFRDACKELRPEDVAELVVNLVFKRFKTGLKQS